MDDVVLHMAKHTSHATLKTDKEVVFITEKEKPSLTHPKALAE